MRPLKIQKPEKPVFLVSLLISGTLVAQQPFSAVKMTSSDTAKVVSIDTVSKPVDPSTFNIYTEPSKERLPHYTGRKWQLAGLHIGLCAASYVALDKAWYADYPKSRFHFFNDNGEWNQMDKAGHTWTAYQMSRLSGKLWSWTGMSPEKSAWLGGLSGIAYQSVIEVQDGFSSEWGFSWGDMTANATGSALYVVQELLWHEQRLQIKLGYWPYDYSTPELAARRDQLFGKSIQERILKDYNSQTYWLSANLSSFLPDSKLPKWLNLAVGYSANGMLGGMKNEWTDKADGLHSRPDIARTRHFFLSPDIDLTKIKTNSKFLRSVLFVLNAVKIPAPALELSSKGGLKGHLIYF